MAPEAYVSENEVVSMLFIHKHTYTLYALAAIPCGSAPPARAHAPWLCAFREQSLPCTRLSRSIQNPAQHTRHSTAQHIGVALLFTAAATTATAESTLRS